MSLFNHKSSNFNTAVGFKDDDEAKNHREGMPLKEVGLQVGEVKEQVDHD